MLHAAPSRTELVKLLFGQLPCGELHFHAMNGALRCPGHNRPIINLLSYRNVAGEQVATQIGSYAIASIFTKVAVLAPSACGRSQRKREFPDGVGRIRNKPQGAFWRFRSSAQQRKSNHQLILSRVLHCLGSHGKYQRWGLTFTPPIPTFGGVQSRLII